MIPGSSLLSSATEALGKYITPTVLNAGGGLLSSLGSILPSWGKLAVPIGMGMSAIGGLY